MTTSSTAPLLAVQNLSARRAGRLVLEAIELKVFPGEIWGLIGPNGAGKSTLLELMVGELAPSTGQVAYGGRALESISPADRALWFALSGREERGPVQFVVRELLELGALSNRKAEPAPSVHRAATLAGVGHLLERQVHTLSEGERQRVHTARALAQSPKVLLLDEATAHLDLLGREQSFRSIAQYVGGDTAALIVIHDLDIALRRLTHLAVLSEGRLVASGPAEQVLTRELLAEVFGLNATVMSDGEGRFLRVLGPEREGT